MLMARDSRDYSVLIDDLIKRQAWVDPLADAIQPLVGNTLTSSPPARRLKDLLNGVWLRHSLHAVLTDVTIGAFTMSALLDLLGIGEGAGSKTNRAADTLLAAGVASALPTAAAGLADWSEIGGQARRVGLIHMLLNLSLVAINCLSLLLRGSGKGRGPARILSLGSYAGMTVAAYLGGHLVYRHGIAVSRDAFVDGPDKFQPVADAADLEEGRMHQVVLDGRPVVLLKEERTITCFEGTCPHFGGPLWEGELDGHTLTCPWHGSRFDVTTGEIVCGPTTHPLPTYDTRVRAGKVEVRLHGS